MFRAFSNGCFSAISAKLVIGESVGIGWDWLKRVAQCSGLRLDLHVQSVSGRRIKPPINAIALDNLTTGMIQPEVNDPGVVNLNAC